MQWIDQGLWELSLHEGWNVRDDPECLTITRSDAAAFQLSSATKLAGPIELPEIRDSRELPEGVSPTDIALGDFRGFAANYVDEEGLWQIFWLVHGSLLVFATYRGTEESWAKDRREVLSMLNTIRVRATANRLAS
jgi:hypothetical protein